MKKALTVAVLSLIALSSNGQALSYPQKIIEFGTRHKLVSNFGTGDLLDIDISGGVSYSIQNAGMIDAIEIVDNVIYGTADNGLVKGYDLSSKELVMNLDMSNIGAQLVTGLVADSAGILYGSERFGTRIFKINPKTEEYWVFAEGNGLVQPNGMLYERDNNRILVCLDIVNPSVMAISLADSSVTTVVTTTLPGADGVARDKYGFYYVTGYYNPG